MIEHRARIRGRSYQQSKGVFASATVSSPMFSLSQLALVSLVAGTNPYLDSGRELYRSVRFKDAEAQLQLARRVPTSTRDERREALDLLARAIAAQGRLEDAEAVYAE